MIDSKTMDAHSGRIYVAVLYFISFVGARELKSLKI